jgi:hypothetical protein
MAQLKADEWPADKEPTTTEREVPASTQAAHDRATERAEAALKDRLDLHEPVERNPEDTPPTTTPTASRPRR